MVSALLLVGSGNSPGDILQVVTDEGFTVRSLIATLNRAAPYYLAGVAVAIGFKMNLFNIGVEGQYRLAALVAAAVGAAITLPAPLHLAVILLTAMLVGMAWASIAGVLRATRGVSEVISTIMLNAIALGLTPYLLERFFRRPKKNATDYAKVTESIPTSGRFPSLNSAIDKIGIDVPRAPACSRTSSWPRPSASSTTCSSGAPASASTCGHRAGTRSPRRPAASAPGA